MILYQLNDATNLLQSISELLYRGKSLGRRCFNSWTEIVGLLIDNQNRYDLEQSVSQYIYINIYILGYFRQNKSNVQCNGYNWIKHSTYQLSVTPYLCISGAIWCPYQPNLHGSWPRSWATVIMILDASDPHLLHPMDNLSIHTFLPI